MAPRRASDRGGAATRLEPAPAPRPPLGAGAINGAITTTALDLADCRDDPGRALDFVADEISKAWRQLTRPSRARPLGSAEMRLNGADEVAAYEKGAWVPEAARKRTRRSALDRASLAKLHRGRRGYLEHLVKKANF